MEDYSSNPENGESLEDYLARLDQYFRNIEKQQSIEQHKTIRVTSVDDIIYQCKKGDYGIGGFDFKDQYPDAYDELVKFWEQYPGVPREFCFTCWSIHPMGSES